MAFSMSLVTALSICHLTIDDWIIVALDVQLHASLGCLRLQSLPWP